MAKKIVIVGGGISGLTAAVYGAKAGFDVTLYEQHTVAGGECTGWNRDGYYIDNCIHWMMGTTPGSDLYRLWETVGAVGEGIEIRRFPAMYTSELEGQKLTLWQDADRTEREMLALAPADAKEIRQLMRFCRLARKVQIPAKIPSELMGPGDGLRMLLTMGDALKIFRAYQGMNVQDLMDRFSHPLIRCLISDFTPADSQASSFVMAYGNFISGDGGIPAGGSRAMADRMRRKAEDLGVRIVTGKAVEKIRIDENAGHAASVLLASGEEVPCDYVIPACDMSVTFGRLLPKDRMGDLLREMYADRKAYPVYNTFQTALAVDSAENPIETETIWNCPEMVFTPGMGERITVKSYAYEPDFAPAGKQILQTLQGGRENVYEYWVRLYQDPQAYQREKIRLAERTREQLELHFPQLKGRLTVLDAWTPMTYTRYCSAYKGFYQAFSISKDSAKLPYPPAWMEGIDNVVLAGQWITPPGGLPGSATAGKFAIQRILKKEGRAFRL
ncbi:MAG: NAD(P)/FAD-dependent oxidoreductase [Oscillospiraceae bacterium]|nr:NAD(P)/FAD-dependent oxidoreductase [Oscillospiraceae bacterium]